MFEHKSRPLLPRWKFYQRIARCVSIVIGIVAFSLQPRSLLETPRKFMV